MFKIDELPIPSFSVGDYVTVVGEYAKDWENDYPARICEIRFLRDWGRYNYCLIDKNGYMCDEWKDCDLLKQTRESGTAK